MSLAARPRSLAAHELFAEQSFGLVLVVRTAEQPDILDGGGASLRDGHPVIELDPLPAGAAMSVGADERAAAAIALPDLSFHVGRDLPRL